VAEDLIKVWFGRLVLDQVDLTIFTKFFRPLNTQLSTLNFLPLSSAMECPEEVAGHDVGDNGEQHQENRDPENPTVVHSAPARRAISVVLVTMLSIVHTKQGSDITSTGVLGKEKRPSWTGGFMTAQEISVSLSP